MKIHERIWSVSSVFGYIIPVSDIIAAFTNFELFYIQYMRRFVIKLIIYLSNY